VQFAFYGNHIDRYKQRIIKKATPKLDLILAVEDLKVFHKENLERNKAHYTMLNRTTKNLVLNYFQSKGAKVHFNYGIKMEDEELSEQTGKPNEVVVSLNHYK
jgi:Phosphatidate cytidylyltransferase, mitochondrial